MLRQRILTALVLAGGFLALLLLSPWYVFGAFIGLIVAVGAWEWSALAGWRSLRARCLYLASVLAGMVLAWWLIEAGDAAAIRTALLVACGWWAVALLWIQGYPSSAIIWSRRPLRGLMGWFVLLPAFGGLLLLRRQPAGEVLILLVVLLVACADIGAYFTGRAIGRHKLAPRVSPGKTWEGVLGGLAVALAAGLLINAIGGRAGWLLVVALVVPTVLVSVVGDLLESMVKRHQGVKDSGHILPGHGGVLDRVDGLSAAVPVFALALLLSDLQL